MYENYSLRWIDEEEIDPPLDGTIKELLCSCFPDWSEIFRLHRTWHKTAPIFSVLCEESGTEKRLIGHVAVVVRAVTTTWNFRYRVASIQGVAVLPEYRKMGLARKMLDLAIQEVKRRGFEFAILFCKEPLVPYYVSLGWKLAEDHVVMRNESDLPISMRSNCPMYLELKNEPFPEGPLDVHRLRET